MGRSSALDWVRGKRIGEGCFGTVSLGVNRSDGRVFAVKSVDRATCFPSQLEALEREIRILRSLSSPYVAQYLGDDESCENSTSFRNLHVAYVPGGRTIADAAARDEETVRSLTWCLVSALKHVHSKGFVHCDVKGRNVLIGPGLNRATLVDFGSAAEIGAPTPLRGSPLWMAPEVVRGESQGTESDVWSLGCTVLEIVTGRPAWEDRGGETLRTIGFSDALPEFPPELSESADDFIRKCLQRDPKKRWSCERLLRHPFLAGAAVPEEDSSAPGPSPRCVLDCDFDDDDVEEDRSGESSARERIGKLAGIGGVNWESEGWTVVREFGREGVVSEFSNSSRVEREGLGTSSEYHPKFGASLCCRDGQRKCHNLMVAWLSTLYNFNIIITVLLFVKKFNELITSYTSLQFANITRHTDKFYRL